MDLSAEDRCYAERLAADGLCDTLPEAEVLVTRIRERTKQKQQRVQAATPAIDFDKVIGIAFHKLRFVNEALRDEMRQDAVLAIVEHVADGGKTDQALLITIAYRAMVRHGQAAGKRAEHSQESFPDRRTSSTLDRLFYDAVESGLFNVEEMAILQAAHEGKTQGEVAKELGISQQAVSKRVSRLAKKIQESRL